MLNLGSKVLVLLGLATMAWSECAPSCQLDVGCPLNYELAGDRDNYLLTRFTTSEGEQYSSLAGWCDNVQCGKFSFRNLPRVAYCQEDGSWKWAFDVAPDCLTESQDCCLVQTDCAYNFQFNSPNEWGFEKWRGGKDVKSSVQIECSGSGTIFGDGTATACVDATWYEGEVKRRGKKYKGKTLDQWLQDEGCDISVVE